MMQDDPLGLALPPASGAAERVRAWVKAAWELPEAATILVCEARCSEPGCPPTETVIAVSLPGGERLEHRVHKAMGRIDRDDIPHRTTLG